MEATSDRADVDSEEECLKRGGEHHQADSERNLGSSNHYLAGDRNTGDE